MTQTHMIPFHGERVLAVETPQGVFVPVKPLAESLGLAWQPQHAKMKARPTLWGITLIVIPSEGGMQDTICIPKNRIAAWLFSISPSRVAAEIRPWLERLQGELADAMDAWFQQQFGPRMSEMISVPADEYHALLHFKIAELEKRIPARRRKTPPVTAEEVKAWRLRIADGASQEQVAREYGRSSGTISLYIRGASLPARLALSSGEGDAA